VAEEEAAGLDALLEVGHQTQVQHVHGHDARRRLVGVEEAVAKDAGAGVYAENEHFSYEL